ncbi:MAG TPA: class I SAM-dependent methyltransferase [Sphingobacteriaceae bacterium]|nr:class I SAM-dependent methyltransferase [Sphingobacteriaceae bacterium]
MPSSLDAEHLAARLYDAFHPDPEPEAEFWLSWLPGNGEPAGGTPAAKDILVLPARTGELAAAMARRGHRVWAVDTAAVMLREGARRWLDHAGPDRLHLVPGELSRLQLDRTFDFACMPRDGLNFQEGSTAMRNTAAGILAHLRPGGGLAAQIQAPPPPGTPRGPIGSTEPTGPQRPHLMPAGWQAVRAVEERWDGKQRVRRVSIYRVAVDGGQPVEVRHVEELCRPTLADVQGIMQDVGFVDVEIRQAGGGSMVLLARRPGSGAAGRPAGGDGGR